MFTVGLQLWKLLPHQLIYVDFFIYLFFVQLNLNQNIRQSEKGHVKGTTIQNSVKFQFKSFNYPTLPNASWTTVVRYALQKPCMSVIFYFTALHVKCQRSYQHSVGGQSGEMPVSYLDSADTRAEIQSGQSNKPDHITVSALCNLTQCDLRFYNRAGGRARAAGLLS